MSKPWITLTPFTILTKVHTYIDVDPYGTEGNCSPSLGWRTAMAVSHLTEADTLCYNRTSIVAAQRVDYNNKAEYY